jgi:hypothetical protein
MDPLPRSIVNSQRGWLVYRDLGLVYQGDFDQVLRQLNEDYHSGARIVWLNSQAVSGEDRKGTEIKADQSTFRLFIERNGVRVPSDRDLLISAPRPVPTSVPSERPATPVVSTLAATEAADTAAFAASRPVNRGGSPGKWLWTELIPKLRQLQEPFATVGDFEEWLINNVERPYSRPRGVGPDITTVRRAIARHQLDQYVEIAPLA